MASTETSRSTEANRRTDGPAPTCWGRTLHSVPAHATHERVCGECIISPESGQGVLHTRYSATMAGCLIAAIDAVRTAADYAKTKRVGIAFDAGNVQALASTIYIQHERKGGGR